MDNEQRAREWIEAMNIHGETSDHDAEMEKSLASLLETVEREAIAQERNRAARACDRIAQMVERGAGEFVRGERLRQVGRMIRSGWVDHD